MVPTTLEFFIVTVILVGWEVLYTDPVCHNSYRPASFLEKLH